MSAKKPATPETPIKDALSDIDQATNEIDHLAVINLELQADLTAAVKLNVDLNEENAHLLDKLANLNKLNDMIIEDQDGTVFEYEISDGVVVISTEEVQRDPTASTTRDIKTEMLIALLPTVGIEHPRPMAQKALAAVNVILETWGLSDE